MPSVSRVPALTLRLIVLLALLNALVAAAIDMYLPAFPAVGTGLGISPEQVQQTLTIFLVGLALGQGLYGPLLDRYGRRAPLLGGVVLFTLGSLLATLAQSFEMLLVARFLQALGAAAGAVTPRAIVADICDTQQAARAFSMLMQVTMIAPITAPLIGGSILLLGSWQLIFWALVAAGVLAFAFSWKMLPETLLPERRIPISVRAITRNYLQLLSHPRFLLYTLASGLILGALFVYVSSSPFVFIGHFGLSPTAYSLIFGAAACGLIVTSQINLSLLKRYSVLQALYVGLACFMLGASLLALLVASGHAQVWSFAILLAMTTSSLGMIMGNLSAVTMSYAGRFAGIASSLMGMMQFLLAGICNFLVNLTPTTLSTLPMALSGLGCAVVILCVVARRMPLRD